MGAKLVCLLPQIGKNSKDFKIEIDSYESIFLFTFGLDLVQNFIGIFVIDCYLLDFVLAVDSSLFILKWFRKIFGMKKKAARIF